ncbi:Os07g0576600 [Oryza sativa Japonica Group]|uniref:Os07g0576600 protein n=1 Tax=Oryza sativa subsp. japonica TaxID=39947 RepID=Q0D573_ORYSJ|nr:Os07g0576600 [Oryza sativa Japonica Group]|eukprot:NP_001060086.2 Os07g0576600 [Oryza sativa Japonica Group]
MASRRHEQEHEESSLQAAEAELSSARIVLESIKEEGLRFTTSIERTRRETARVTDEIPRLTEQEKAASAQARSRLEAVTAADERADETISKLAAILRQLEDDAEAAEKEKTLTETENRRAMSDAENIDAEIAAAEQRIRESVRELGAARASEAAATARLKAIVESATLATAAAATSRSSSSRNVTNSRSPGSSTST